MVIKIMFCLAGSIVFFGFFVFVYMLHEYISHRPIMKGQRIRQQNSDIEYAKHIDVLKPKKWYRHKNFGVDPKVLKKPIEIMDYSVDCNGIIEKRGLA